MKKMMVCLLVVACCFFLEAYAADGDLDTSFNANIPEGIIASAVQADGKIIIFGGNFGVARLNADGSLDANFKYSIVYYGGTTITAIQEDGKILFGGGFYIARLNTDGSFDSGFIGRDIYSNVHEINTTAIQADGKILIGGDFEVYNSASASSMYNLVRLNMDGSLDTGFNFNPDIGSTVSAMALQRDGKIIIVGNAYYVARLNTDGSLDTDFNPSFEEKINSITMAIIQLDGKIIIGGRVDNGSGYVNPYIVRLNVDGSLDNSFNFDSTVYSSTIYINIITLQRDGKIVIGGSSYSRGIPGGKPFIERLNTDGSVDTSFNTSNALAPRGEVYTISMQADGNMVVGGQFADTSNHVINSIVRLIGHAESDNDGIADIADNCLVVSNPDQLDTDDDSIGDACDSTPNGDTDGDDVDNLIDNCPLAMNANQKDNDGDGLGNTCDILPSNPYQCSKAGFKYALAHKQIKQYLKVCHQSTWRQRDKTEH